MKTETTIKVDISQAQIAIAELRAVVIRFETSVRLLATLMTVVDKSISIPEYPKTFA